MNPPNKKIRLKNKDVFQSIPMSFLWKVKIVDANKKPITTYNIFSNQLDSI